MPAFREFEKIDPSFLEAVKAVDAASALLKGKLGEEVGQRHIDEIRAAVIEIFNNRKFGLGEEAIRALAETKALSHIHANKDVGTLEADLVRSMVDFLLAEEAINDNGDEFEMDESKDEEEAA